MAQFPLPVIVFTILITPFVYIFVAGEIESRIQQEDKAFVGCCKEANLKKDITYEKGNKKQQEGYERFEATHCNYSTFLEMPDGQIDNNETGVEKLLRLVETPLSVVLDGTDPWVKVRIYYDCMVKLDVEYKQCCLLRGMDKNHRCFVLCDSKISALAGYGLLTYTEREENGTKYDDKYKIKDEYLKKLRTQMDKCVSSHKNTFELGDYLQVALGCWRDAGRIGGDVEICNAPPGSEL